MTVLETKSRLELPFFKKQHDDFSQLVHDFRDAVDDVRADLDHRIEQHLQELRRLKTVLEERTELMRQKIANPPRAYKPAELKLKHDYLRRLLEKTGDVNDAIQKLEDGLNGKMVVEPSEAGPRRMPR